ncbi:serine/threonine-protein kinase ULK3 [Aplysia californica]|uniref:Serine/threonine-protein kinase ULK3 n=1 Tax=Aplysia californica TaxID=6500 RepID=A0ABM1AFW3_APLCA|nr:serine/threonine-protein kinase ULK3 [Aplysia californica]
MASRPNSAGLQPSATEKLIPKPSLGQYVFTEKLGSGTYATVYKAYSKTGVREVVAIKCVLKSSLNKASTENLLTEIQLLKNLKHEHIVSLKDFQWDNNYIYLIMEFCSGGDLSRFIRSKRALPEHIVKRFLQQIASAMKFLWDNNVAHMDLKPQNILLTSSSSPQIKLADFGFAKHLYDGDNLHVMRGSPLYMAPEIICRGSYDNRVDLWSIGVILFECLFGKPPFASKSFKELGEKIWDQKPVEIPAGFDVSGKARDLTLRLLQRQPRDRITFEEFFAHPFVDMKHIPSKDSLPNAVETVSKAINKDNEGDYKSAVRLYCEALEYFMPAIHYEKSTQKKESLRAKVKVYINRAETLKQLMKPHSSSRPPRPPPPMSPYKASPTSSNKSTSKDSPHHSSQKSKSPETSPESKAVPSASKTPKPDLLSDPVEKSSADGSPGSRPEENTCAESSPPGAVNNSPSSTSQSFARSMSNDVLEELMSLCSDSQELMAVLKLVNAAILEEQEENYESCLHHYEIALGAVLKILPNEPKGKRKNLINAQVVKWMDKAEQIKSYLEVLNLNTQDTSVEDEEEENLLMSQSKQCCVQ